MIVDFFQGLQTGIAARGFHGPVSLGLAAIAGQDDPTAGRVVCYPTNDPINPTTRIGGNPRARRTRMASLETHVWGPVAISQDGAIDSVQSLRNAESLLNVVINAAMDLAVGTIQFSAIQWDERTAVARAGWLAILTITVEVPIVDTTFTTVSAPPLKAIIDDVFVRPDGTVAADSPSCIGMST
jgi:hypothetical protein